MRLKSLNCIVVVKSTRFLSRDTIQSEQCLREIIRVPMKKMQKEPLY